MGQQPWSYDFCITSLSTLATAFPPPATTGVRAPLVAFEYRAVLDGLLALAALHLHRQTQNALSTQDKYKPPGYDYNDFLAGIDPLDMGREAFSYFHRAVRGHREGLQDLKPKDYEGAFMSPTLLSITSLFLLAEDVIEKDAVAPLNEWLRLGVGPRELAAQWKACAGLEVLRVTGVINEQPDLSNNAELFNPENREPFQYLHSWHRSTSSQIRKTKPPTKTPSATLV